MEILINAVQIILALGLINVWLLRFNHATVYRGGSSTNMLEEFHAYGLPSWFMYFIGFLKLLIAILLILGIWYDNLVKPSALILSILMIGAIAMHIKIKDPNSKSIPAIAMLAMSIATYLLH